MREHRLPVVVTAALVLCVAGVLGNHYAPRAHVWIFVIVVSCGVVLQLGRGRRG